jgi:hypothetical protein
MTELLAVVIGAVLAYTGTWLQQSRDRKRSRTSLATILLSEVRMAEMILRGLYRQPASGELSPDAFDLLTSASTEALAHFRPATVQHLLAFGGYLRRVHDLRDRIRTASAQDERAYNAGVLTAIIQIAVGSVPALKQSLEAEGGTHIPLQLPTAPAMKPGETRPPALPPSPFPS